MEESYVHIVFWSAICSTAGFLLWELVPRYRAHQRAERVFPAKYMQQLTVLIFLRMTTVFRIDSLQACETVDFRRRQALVATRSLLCDLRYAPPPDLPAGIMDRLADIGRRRESAPRSAGDGFVQCWCGCRRCWRRRSTV